MIHYMGLDFETYCEVSIKDVGLENYVNHPSFQPLIASVHYKRPDENRTTRTFQLFGENNQVMPFISQVKLASWLIGHNVAFEQRVLKWLGFNTDNVLDSAVAARTAGASSALAGAAPQLLGVPKLGDNGRLVRKFCMGQAPSKETHLDDFEWPQFVKYCEKDAELAYDIYRGFAPAAESKPFALTLAMNQVGWHVDLEAVDKMIELSEANKARALKNFRDLHDVRSDPKKHLNLNSMVQLKKWCADRGIRSNSFDEANVQRLIDALRARGLHQLTADQSAVWDMLVTKQVIGGSALKKLPVIKALTGADGRLRDQYIHCGAGQTHRTSGVGAQMQNLKRIHGDPADMARLYDANDEWRWDNDMLASNIRQVFCAEDPAGLLMVGDFASVESRGLAYMAGEDWKLDEYRRGSDIYKVNAAKFYNIPVGQVDKDARTFGKVAELACGYYAGGESVQSFANKMGVELTMPEAATLVYDWRAVNPKIVELWKKLDDLLHMVADKPCATGDEPLGDHLYINVSSAAALDSIQAFQPGALDITVKVRAWDHALAFTRVFRGVYRRGGQLCHLKPSNAKTGPLWTRDAAIPGSKKRRVHTIYGGKLSGILTQSLCRELFFNSLRQVAEVMSRFSNVKLVGQFHDEIVLEWTPPMASDTVAAAKHIQEQFRLAMEQCVLPGFPLKAEIQADRRYIK